MRYYIYVGGFMFHTRRVPTPRPLPTPSISVVRGESVSASSAQAFGSRCWFRPGFGQYEHTFMWTHSALSPPTRSCQFKQKYLPLLLPPSFLTSSPSLSWTTILILRLVCREPSVSEAGNPRKKMIIMFISLYSASACCKCKQDAGFPGERWGG